MLFCTYNIHYGVGADGTYDVARIADAVAEAHIVCLQEAVSGWPQNDHADQTSEIAGRLNRYSVYHGAMEADASTVGPDGRIATAEHLTDTWIVAGNSEEEVDSFPREGRIDHVFVTHDLAPRVKSARIGYGIDASDHWPVFVEFDL